MSKPNLTTKSVVSKAATVNSVPNVNLSAVPAAKSNSAKSAALTELITRRETLLANAEILLKAIEFLRS